jgi:predicted nucleic acid-binding protein
MIVVSNTSPVSNLAEVGQLNLLEQLYGQIVIPDAVYHEIVIAGAGLTGAAAVQAAGWIQRRQVAGRATVALLQIELDEGEAEAIALALEIGADLLLVDERRGRAVAARLGINAIGLLAVLLEAKHRGLILAVKPVLDDLVTRAGFWVAGALYARVLQAAGE